MFAYQNSKSTTTRKKKKHYYASAFSGQDLTDFEEALEATGLDEEIAIIRMKIKYLSINEPWNVKLLMQATNTLQRLTRAKETYFKNDDLFEEHTEAFRRIFQSIPTELLIKTAPPDILREALVEAVQSTAVSVEPRVDDLSTDAEDCPSSPLDTPPASEPILDASDSGQRQCVSDCDADEESQCASQPISARRCHENRAACSSVPGAEKALQPCEPETMGSPTFSRTVDGQGQGTEGLAVPFAGQPPPRGYDW